MTSSHPTTVPCQWFSRIASVLDRRTARRLAILFFGAVLARGRRTVTNWIRAVKLRDQFRPCYTAMAAAGKKADSIATRQVGEAPSMCRPALPVPYGHSPNPGMTCGRTAGHTSRRHKRLPLT